MTQMVKKEKEKGYYILAIEKDRRDLENWDRKPTQKSQRTTRTRWQKFKQCG